MPSGANARGSQYRLRRHARRPSPFRYAQRQLHTYSSFLRGPLGLKQTKTITLMVEPITLKPLVLVGHSHVRRTRREAVRTTQTRPRLVEAAAVPIAPPTPTRVRRSLGAVQHQTRAASQRVPTRKTARLPSVWNALLNRLNESRREAEALWSAAKSELHRVMRCGVRQVAVHCRPDLAVVGPQYAPGKTEAAVGAVEAAGQAGGAVGRAVTGKPVRKKIPFDPAEQERRKAALEAFMADRSVFLKATLEEWRSAARNNVAAATSRVPTSREDVMSWMIDHEKEFRARMKTAGPDRRRISHRRHAEPGLPEPVQRLQPIGVGEKNRWRPPAGWPQLVYRRGGWHSLGSFIGTGRGNYQKSVIFAFPAHVRPPGPQNSTETIKFNVFF